MAVKSCCSSELRLGTWREVHSGSRLRLLCVRPLLSTPVLCGLEGPLGQCPREAADHRAHTLCPVPATVPALCLRCARRHAMPVPSALYLHPLHHICTCALCTLPVPSALCPCPLHHICALCTVPTPSVLYLCALHCACCCACTLCTVPVPSVPCLHPLHHIRALCTVPVSSAPCPLLCSHLLHCAHTFCTLPVSCTMPVAMPAFSAHKETSL